MWKGLNGIEQTAANTWIRKIRLKKLIKIGVTGTITAKCLKSPRNFITNEGKVWRKEHKCIFGSQTKDKPGKGLELKSCFVGINQIKWHKLSQND